MDLKGFKVLLTKFSKDSVEQHELFMKEHSVRNQSDDKPAGRTMLLLNVPPWATEVSLRRVFPNTERVIFDKITREEIPECGFKTAFVIFKSALDLYKVLKLKELPPLSTPEHPILVGLTKWMHDYNDSVIMQEKRYIAAMKTIKNYDTAEEQKKSKSKSTDDEGWTVVTKKGRNPGISRKESVNEKLAEKLARKEKGLKNFYRHQIRQEKRDQLATLRKKAEEDKKKIQALRQRRAFKPF